MSNSDEVKYPGLNVNSKGNNVVPLTQRSHNNAESVASDDDLESQEDFSETYNFTQREDERKKERIFRNSERIVNIWQQMENLQTEFVQQHILKLLSVL